MTGFGLPGSITRTWPLPATPSVDECLLPSVSTYGRSIVTYIETKD